MRWIEKARSLYVRYGLTGKILLPVAVLSLLFMVVLILWLGWMSQQALVESTRQINVRQFETAMNMEESEWKRINEELRGDAFQSKLRDLYQRRMTDQTTALLRKKAADLQLTDLVLVEGGGALFAANGEPRSTNLPSWLKRLHSRYQNLEPGKTVAPFHVRLPREVPAYFQRTPERTDQTGDVLALCIVSPFLNEWGDVLGLVVGLRYWNGNDEIIQDEAAMIGAHISIVMEGIRVASGTPENAEVLGGVPLAYVPKPDEVARGTVQRLISIEGVRHLSSYGVLRDDQGGAVGLFVVESHVPGAFWVGSKASGMGVVLLGILGFGTFAAFLWWILRRSLAGVIRVSEHMTQLASGRISDVEPVHTGDEIEKLADSVNQMTRSLTDMLFRVDAASRSSASVVYSIEQMIVEVGRLVDKGGSAQNKLEQTSDILAEMIEETVSEMATLGRMAEDNVRIVDNVRSGMTGFRHHAKELLEVSDTTVSAISELTATINSLSGAVTSLNNQVEGASKAIEQIDDSVQGINELTQSAREVASLLSEEAETKARPAMQTANSGMASIRDIVSRVGDAVERVARRSSNIGEVVSVIYEVSDQVKLLSLNAAVLAAQAGDAGRGFMVVANAIRGLSERTNLSISQIEEYVAQVEEESRQAVSEVRLGLDAVEAGVTGMSHLREVVDGIMNSAGRTHALAEQIAEKTRQQGQASLQVSRSIEQVEQIVGTVTSGVGELAKTGDVILGQASLVRSRAEEINESAEEQTRMVNRMAENFHNTQEATNRLTDRAQAGREGVVALRDAMVLVADILKENQVQSELLMNSIETLRRETDAMLRVMGRFTFSK